MISTEIVGIGYSTILQALSAPWRQYATHSGTLGGISPGAAWTTALSDVGFVSYGLVTLAGLFVSIKSRLSKLAPLIPIALSAGAIFLMLYFVPIAGTPNAGIQGRAYLYAYLFGAPLFVVGLRFVSTRKPLVLRSGVFHTRVLPLLIIAVVLSPAVYYGVPRYLYDRTSPLSAVDTRLGFAAEYGAYVFASHYSSSPEVLAIEMVTWMAGDPGIGIAHVAPIQDFVPGGYGSVGDLVRGQCRTMIIRQSITRVPDLYYRVSAADYQYLLAASNIVYSSGDPLILYMTYCASGVPS
jgi:hypothetical protein